MAEKYPRSTREVPEKYPRTGREPAENWPPFTLRWARNGGTGRPVRQERHQCSQVGAQTPLCTDGFQGEKQLCCWSPAYPGRFVHGVAWRRWSIRRSLAPSRSHETRLNRIPRGARSLVKPRSAFDTPWRWCVPVAYQLHTSHIGPWSPTDGHQSPCFADFGDRSRRDRKTNGSKKQGDCEKWVTEAR